MYARIATVGALELITRMLICTVKSYFRKKNVPSNFFLFLFLKTWHYTANWSVWEQFKYFLLIDDLILLHFHFINLNSWFFVSIQPGILYRNDFPLIPTDSSAEGQTLCLTPCLTQSLARVDMKKMAGNSTMFQQTCLFTTGILVRCLESLRRHKIHFSWIA